MYGLPADVDLTCFHGATLIQVCVGQNEVIANLHPNVSITIESSVRITQATGSVDTLDEAKALGAALLGLLGQDVTAVGGGVDGTLTLTWGDMTVVEILDSNKRFESYTVRAGEQLIVV